MSALTLTGSFCCRKWLTLGTTSTRNFGYSFDSKIQDECDIYRSNWPKTNMPSAPSFAIFVVAAALKYGKLARYKAIALVSAPVRNESGKADCYFTDLDVGMGWMECLPFWPNIYLYASKSSGVKYSLNLASYICLKTLKSSRAATISGKYGIWKKKMYHDFQNWSGDAFSDSDQTEADGAPSIMNFWIIEPKWSTNVQPIMAPQSWQTKMHCLRSAEK